MLWQGDHYEALPEYCSFQEQVYWLAKHSVWSLKMSTVCSWSSLNSGEAVLQSRSHGRAHPPKLIKECHMTVCGVVRGAFFQLYHRCSLVISSLTEQLESCLLYYSLWFQRAESTMAGIQEGKNQSFGEKVASRKQGAWPGSFVG